MIDFQPSSSRGGGKNEINALGRFCRVAESEGDNTRVRDSRYISYAHNKHNKKKGIKAEIPRTTYTVLSTCFV